MNDTEVVVQLKCSLQDIEKLDEKKFSHNDNTIELARTKVAQLFMDNGFSYIHVFNIFKLKDI